MTKKLKMTLRQANNVVRLINVLNSVKDENFDYSSICQHKTSDDSPFNCGTVACAYGYLPNALPKKFKWIKNIYNYCDNSINYVVVPADYVHDEYSNLNDAGYEAQELAAKELGMTDDELYEYFMGGAVYRIYGVSFSNVTRQLVIKALTKFINQNGYEIA